MLVDDPNENPLPPAVVVVEGVVVEPKENPVLAGVVVVLVEPPKKPPVAGAVEVARGCDVLLLAPNPPNPPVVLPPPDR